MVAIFCMLYQGSLGEFLCNLQYKSNITYVCGIIGKQQQPTALYIQSIAVMNCNKTINSNKMQLLCHSKTKQPIVSFQIAAGACISFFCYAEYNNPYFLRNCTHHTPVSFLYAIVITWAQEICLICMPNPEGHRLKGASIYIRQILSAHVITDICIMVCGWIKGYHQCYQSFVNWSTTRCETVMQ